MKICVSSYSFTRYIASGKLTQLTVLDKAKELGFDGIEYATDKPTIEPYVAQIAQRSRELDLPIACYLTGADFVNRDFEAEVARVCEEVDMAAALGAPMMRHDTTWSFPAGATFEDILPIISEGCRRVTEYAKTKGIRTLVENHGTLVQDSARVVALYRAVGNPNFSLLADMGNFMCADENSAVAMGQCAALRRPYTCQGLHIQVRRRRGSGRGLLLHSRGQLSARHDNRTRRGTGASVRASD